MLVLVLTHLLVLAVAVAVLAAVVVALAAFELDPFVHFGLPAEPVEQLAGHLPQSEAVDGISSWLQD